MDFARTTTTALVLTLASACSCGGGNRGPGVLGDASVPPPAPTCAAAAGGGNSTIPMPTFRVGLRDSYHEGWLGSPAVADLDADGMPEIIAARSGRLVVWHANGDVVFTVETEDRIWASPVVADIVPTSPGLEVAFAARDLVHLVDANGDAIDGFPYRGRDELRTIATGDIDGDGALEIVVVSSTRLEAGGQRDIVMAIEADGSEVAGFPPNTTGASGCDDACYVTGGYDQNLALGDVDDDGISDIFATQDNAYLSLHDGTGRAFDASTIFEDRTKFLGVRFMLDYAEAQQGFSNMESTSNQAHFTNSAPAIADVDGDGTNELIVLGSVQNAAQSDRFRGVALFVVRNDGTRPTAWVTPHHVPAYLAGLWDFDGTNYVGATNQVSVAELFGDRPGPEMVFAGFDGIIHCVDSSAQTVWQHQYTMDDEVLTAGVAIADLTGDGTPEIVFATYSPDEGKSELVVLDGGGAVAHEIPLPRNGSMAVPTIADVDGDGDVEIVVALKESPDGEPQVLVYDVPGSADNCLLWPTGRGNLRRDGYVPSP